MRSLSDSIFPTALPFDAERAIWDERTEESKLARAFGIPVRANRMRSPKM